MTQKRQPRARMMSGPDLDDLVRNCTETRSHAESLISDAKAEAARIEREARARVEQNDRDLEARCDERLRAFIDKDKLERHGTMMASLAAQIDSIRREHAALTPWLTRLVRTSVERVVGLLEDEDLIARVIQQGIADLDRSYRLVIRVHPLEVARISVAIERDPECLSAVDEVLEDPSLERGAILMDCSAGTIEVSLSTQIDAVCEAIGAATGASAYAEAAR